ncbi:SART-1 family protein DOT2 [Rosa sericea]
MDVERYEQREERYDRDDSPVREQREDGNSDDLEENGSRHRSKDRKKSSRGEEKDSRSKDRDRSRRSGGDDVVKEREKESKDLEKDRVSKERRKDDRDERYKDRSRDNKVRERDYDREKEHERGKDRKDRGKDREVEKDGDKGRDKERAKEKIRDREKERERDRAKEKEREKEREKHKDREKGRESLKDTDREKGKDKYREKEREADQDKEKSRDRQSRRSVDAYESSKIGERDENAKLNDDDNRDKDIIKQGKMSHNAAYEQNAEGLAGGAHLSASELEERILKTKEERLKKKTEDIPEVLAWVNRSRKLEEKRNAEKEKALQLSKIFEEQDNVAEEESEDEEAAQDMTHNLAGVKVLHGIDKVMDGGAVVLTLKDQNILADGDINEDVDMLENVELGEQKQRDDAYKAAKKKTGIYADKFNDDPTLEKKILPQYDDPAADEGLTLDAGGRFTGEAEKKLEELRMKLQGGSTKNRSDDLNMSGKITSDYYTNEEMLQFKKPKKKKTFRKKEKLDLDALEAEAVSAGLGAADLGSRKDGKRQATREEQERLEAEKRNSAYQLAKDKANEASKALRQDTQSVKAEEDETPYFADDYDEIDKALERSRKIALQKKQEEKVSGPKAIARLATAAASSTTADDQFSSTGQSQENKVVFTEMEEFVLGLQLEEESHKPESEDVFMQEDEEPKASVDVEMGEPSGWTEVNEIEENKAQSAADDNEEIVPDETIHEVAVGKGLSGVLKLLKERGNLKEGIEWGGRNMDKKKSKLLGIVDDDEEPKETHTVRRRKDEQKDTRLSGHQKEMRPPKVYQEKDIHIERTDEFGRTLTPKEAFRVLSHKFHGKGPGKMKQEKRMKQYHEELKLKQMKSSDTPSLSVERMRETQARLQTPYLVLSGHVKPGQTSDPRSGFATVEKDLPGGLTPMLGDRKVEHFLGIKRKDETESSGTPKKPKT